MKLKNIFFNRRTIFFALFIAAVFLFSRYFFSLADNKGSIKKEASVVEPSLPPPKPLHLKTPDPVKAIYMTSWVAGTKKWRSGLIDFIKSSEINSVVIDVKDYSGRVSFDTGDEFIKKIGSEENRVPDMKEFISALHDAGIYTIGRITVFQDPFFSKKNLSMAVQRKNGALWKDKKGLSYMDPAAKEYWDYVVRIAKASEKVGFDELNFDYIRFPSDGDMRDITFPVSGIQGLTHKETVLNKFFAYLQGELKSTGVPMSADVFGMVTTNKDDLNIGQVLEGIEPYFDYISPMVYPSHYPPTFDGFKNPAAHPYEIIKLSMDSAVERLKAASSTPTKLRPWLQDFNLGAIYDSIKIRAEKKAVYDAGLSSWMAWDAANKYTRSAYDPIDAPGASSLKP